MTTPTTTSLCPSLEPPNLTSPLAKLKPSHFHQHCKTLVKRENINRGICRAQLSDDTPFAAAIGVCVLSSLLFPNTVTKDEEAESFSGITATDTRFAVMGVMSFIPYFNWSLEASIKNGDIHGFQLFSEAAKFLPSLTKKKDGSLWEHQQPSKEGKE